MSVTLLLGSAKVDITPVHPVQLAGFASREGQTFEAVKTRIYLRAHVFVQAAPGGGEERAALLSADLLFWSDTEARKLRERLALQCGISYERIILHATHNHSGPSVSERTVGIGTPDPQYVEELARAAVSAVAEALLRLEPVQVFKGTGCCSIGVNRRKREGEQVVLGLNPAGTTDSDLTVIAFCNPREEVKAVLVHYACHPVLSSANEVAAEFCGLAMEDLEQRLGSEAICTYLQGCCGDINPDSRLVEGDDGHAAMEVLGQALAGEALRVLEQGLRRLDEALITSSSLVSALPYDQVPTIDQWSQIAADAAEPEYRREWARRFVQRPGWLHTHARFEAMCLAIADGLTLVAMNGEMVVEYGLFIKRAGDHFLPLAYSNGMAGYITTARQLEEGGYEPRESVPYFGMPAPFDAGTERQVLGVLEELLEQNGGWR